MNPTQAVLLGAFACATVMFIKLMLMGICLLIGGSWQSEPTEGLR